MNQIEKLAEAYAQEKSCSDEHGNGIRQGFIAGFMRCREIAAIRFNRVAYHCHRCKAEGASLDLRYMILSMGEEPANAKQEYTA